MSWGLLPVEVREVAVSVLTARQLEAWKLELAGLSLRQIAGGQSVSVSTVRGRLRDVRHKLRMAGVEQDSGGRFFVRRRA